MPASKRCEMETLLDDEKLERAFVEHGFAVLPLLNHDEIQALLALYDSVTPEQPVDIYPTVPDFYATTLSSDVAKRRAVSEGIVAIVEDKLRRTAPRHRIAFATFVAKRRRSNQGTVPLHQDWWITDNTVHRAAHFWCPLTGVDEYSACLRVVPGVHRLLDSPFPVSSQYRTRFHPVRQILEEKFAIAVPMGAGSALVYDQRMLHGSGENLAARTRVAINCAVLPRDLAAQLYYRNDAAPGWLDRFEVPDPFLCEFEVGGRLDPPYPPGVRRLSAVEVSTAPLRPEDLESLPREAR